MAQDHLHHPPALTAASRSLRGLLGVIIAVERRFGHEQSPLALLQQIMNDARWAWLQPLYRLIVDIDHATDREPPGGEQLATMGQFAQDLLTGRLARVLDGEAEAEDAVGFQVDALAAQDVEHAAEAALFVTRYRELLQADPEVAIAHAAALQALRHLPALEVTAERRRQLYRQWLQDSAASR